MADRVLFIGWGAPMPGREERSLEVFDEALGILGRMQQDGGIEKFDVVLLDPNSDLGGYIEVTGTVQQITALRADEQFRRNTVDAGLCVGALRHLEGVTDAAVAREMAIYQEALGKVKQMA